MDAKFTYTKVVMEERMVIDLPLPGFSQDDVKVKIIKMDCLVKVKIRSTIENGIAFRKKLIGYKDTKEFFVDDGRFDLDNPEITFENGVLRISIPKFAEAIGETVFPS